MQLQSCQKSESKMAQKHIIQRKDGVVLLLVEKLQKMKVCLFNHKFQTHKSKDNIKLIISDQSGFRTSHCMTWQNKKVKKLIRTKRIRILVDLTEESKRVLSSLQCKINERKLGKNEYKTQHFLMCGFSISVVFISGQKMARRAFYFIIIL